MDALVAALVARETVDIVVQPSDGARDRRARCRGCRAVMFVVVVRQWHADRRSYRGPRKHKHVGIKPEEDQIPPRAFNCVDKAVAKTVDECDGGPLSISHLVAENIKNGIAAERRPAPRCEEKLLISHPKRTIYHLVGFRGQIDVDLRVAVAYVEAASWAQLGTEADNRVRAAFQNRLTISCEVNGDAFFCHAPALDGP